MLCASLLTLSISSAALAGNIYGLSATGTGNIYGQSATGNIYGQSATGNIYGQSATGNIYGQSVTRDITSGVIGTILGMIGTLPIV